MRLVFCRADLILEVYERNFINQHNINMKKLIEIPENYTVDIEQAIYDAFGNHEEITKYVNILLDDYSQHVGAMESHHIFPKAIFGDNDIVVDLPINKHFMAHIALHRGYMFKENRIPRVTQSTASAVTAFLRTNNFRLHQLKKLTEEELIEYSFMVEEARKTNSEKSIGCKHYTNLETGQIIFAKECPPGFVRGNKHNKRHFTNPERTMHKMFIPGTEPDGWVSGGTLGVNAGSKHYFDPVTDKLKFTATPEDWYVPYSPCAGKGTYKNIVTDEIRRFETAPSDEWITHNPTTGNMRIYNTETNENKFISMDSELPDGWRHGMSPDVCDKMKGRIEVYDLINNEYKWTREELFDPETMLRQGSHTGWTVIYNVETRQHKWHADKENIPEGWAIGRIDMPSGFIVGYNIETKEIDRFQSEDDIPEGWQKGIPYEMVWIYDTSGKESWVTIQRAEELELFGWEYGRPSMLNNKHNQNNLHIHNPITKEKKTIKQGQTLPDGWVFGLLKNSRPAYKGKKAYHCPTTKQHDYFSDMNDVPTGWVIGTGKKKPRKVLNE